MYKYRLSPLEAARLIGDTSVDAGRVNGGRGTGNEPANRDPRGEWAGLSIPDGMAASLKHHVLRNVDGNMPTSP
jgi:hypothetical protein